MMGSIAIQWPWATVQRHLKGKHNQKEHGRRGGAQQLTLFDRDEYIDEEYVNRKEKKKLYEKLGFEGSYGQKDVGAMTDDEFQDFMDEANQEWEMQSGGYIELGDFVDSTFNYKDEASGLETRVTKVMSSYGVYLQGKVYDEYGYEVGTFERNIEDGTVDHAYFQLSPGAQGKGFGAKYYKHLEESYAEAGLSQVTIHANIDVGGYAWAKMGYDFQYDQDRESFISTLQSEFEDRYGYEPEEPNDYEYGSRWEQYIYDEWGSEPHHSWEIASFRGPDGTKLGKEIMLGSDWMAYKALWEDDPTWEAGQDYYRSKGL